MVILFFFWLHWVLAATHGLSLVAASGDPPCCSEGASHCGGFSCCRAQAPGALASVLVAHGPSCSTACGNPPGPRLEPVSPALAGRFSTTAPPGKYPLFFKKCEQCKMSTYKIYFKM